MPLRAACGSRTACFENPNVEDAVILGPGNRSPGATNVVLVVGVGVLLSHLRSTKAFSFHNRSSSNFAYT